MIKIIFLKLCRIVQFIAIKESKQGVKGINPLDTGSCGSFMVWFHEILSKYYYTVFTELCYTLGHYTMSTIQFPPSTCCGWVEVQWLFQSIVTLHLMWSIEALFTNLAEAKKSRQIQKMPTDVDKAEGGGVSKMMTIGNGDLKGLKIKLF